MTEHAQTILLVCGVFVAMAGAVKSIQYLYIKLREAGRFGLQTWNDTQRDRRIMDGLVSEEGWPNGASSLKESHSNLYDKIGSIGEVLAMVDLRVTEIQRKLEFDTPSEPN